MCYWMSDASFGGTEEGMDMICIDSFQGKIYIYV